jgi:16S rRNA (uracil1498-N3)-methyltransferase
MHLFYTPDIQSELYTLSEEESKHAIRVLRMKIGDKMHLVNGAGTFYEVEIIDDSPKRCAVKVISQQNEFGKRTHFLHIAIAPTKSNDRTEWFIEKATEIGIDEISPILTERCERSVVKMARIENVVKAAMKQSLNAKTPRLNEARTLATFLKESSAQSRFIAHCEAGEKILLPNAALQSQDILVCIGPEGDFSPREIAAAVDAGYTAVSLGESRLRAETAGVVACAQVQTGWMLSGI